MSLKIFQNNFKNVDSSIILLLIIGFALAGCNKPSEPIQKVEYNGVIPEPIEDVVGKGTFGISSKTTIVHHPDLKKTVDYFNEFIKKGIGETLKITELADENSISFVIDTTIKHSEGYKLSVSNTGIVIGAATNRGAFYGVQTLRQLLPACFENQNCKEQKVFINAVSIIDQPRFDYRGMHLDVGRHYFDVDDIKKYIEILALLKFNTFHWHLTEDQGWRIEIKKYPKLTEVGAYRKETLVGHYNDQPHEFDGKQYGGFYTQEEIKEVVAYAQKRNVTIIPEIEMPGHSRAAIAAYPELSCTGEQVEVATKWGIFEDVYCPTEETFTFLQNVLDEVMDLFPGEYIHIGGDEAPKTQWESSDYCQQLIKEKNLKDEHGLQSYFIKRIEQYLNSKGRKIIGWDEILEGGLAPNATVMSWRGIEGAVKAVSQKNDAILTPFSHCYFDHYQSDREDEPLAIGGFLPLEKVYSFNPIPDEIAPENRKYVKGAQGNVWTEYMNTFDKVTYMALPRAAALSEVVWSAEEKREYTNFVKRLEYFQQRLDSMNIKYANHLYEIKGNVEIKDQKISYALGTFFKDKDIRYTIDGSEPTVNSLRYSKPITLDKSVMIKAKVFDSIDPMGALFTQKLFNHKAVGAKIDLSVPPHPSYNAGGKEALVNSIKGNNVRYGDKEWLGFWGDNVEIIVDLGEVTEVNKIGTRFFNANGQWIYLPRQVKVSFSEDNQNYEEEISHTINTPDVKQLVVPQIITTNKKKYRFIKIEVENYGIIPEGAQGAGNKSWMFIDEIIIE